MSEFIWRPLARFIAKPRIADAIIRFAKRTVYSHLPTNEDPSYMERYWVFNPYDRTTQKTRLGWLCPISIRVHHIKREDLDRAHHDHPWNARTIILKGWYIEKRMATNGAGQWSPPDQLGRREWIPATTLHIRRPGQTAALGFGEYHTICEVSDGGVYTLFITGKWRGVWGFFQQHMPVGAPPGTYFIGSKISWKKYLGIGEGQ